MMIVRQLLALLMLAVVSTSALKNIKKCCPDDNMLTNRRCNSTGEKIQLDCQHRYILDPNDDDTEQYEIDNYGRLSYASGLIEEGQYCLTKLKTGEVAVVCFSLTEAEADGKWYGVRAACSLLSVMFVMATLTVYCLVSELRDLQGKCIMHALGALVVALTVLSIMQLSPEFEQASCLFMGFLGYLAFMIMFFWLNVTSFHIWKTVIFPDILGTDKQWHIIYALYGYGMPLLFLVILIVAHNVDGDHIKPGIGVHSCWFQGPTETWTYFYGPTSVLLALNLIFFVWSVISLWKSNKSVNQNRLKSLKYKVALYTKLFIIMGLLWFFEVVSAALDKTHEILDYLWIVTDYLNTLQGLLIFLLLVVFRKRALRGLSNKGFCCITFPNTWHALIDDECLVEEGESRLSSGHI